MTNAVQDLLVILFVGSLLYVLLISRRRIRQLRQIAPSLGMSFDEEGNERLARMLGFAPLFSKGNTITMTNLLRGERNQLQIAIFDLEYITGYTQYARHRTYQTVMAIHLNDRSLPVFSLVQRSLSNSVDELLGGASIELGSHSFQSNYLLSGPNEEKIRALFNQNVIAFFEDHTNLWVEGFDEWFLIYRRYVLVSADDMASFMNLGIEAAARLQA